MNNVIKLSQGLHRSKGESHTSIHRRSSNKRATGLHKCMSIMDQPRAHHTPCTPQHTKHPQTRCKHFQSNPKTNTPSLRKTCFHRHLSSPTTHPNLYLPLENAKSNVHFQRHSLNSIPPRYVTWIFLFFHVLKGYSCILRHLLLLSSHI